MKEQALNHPTKDFPQFWPGPDITNFDHELSSDFPERMSGWPEPDIICLGCSFTSGHCIPIELSWPHIVSVETGLKVNVVAGCGIGYTTIENMLVSHLSVRGLPQQMMFLGPDLQRLHTKVPSSTNKITDHRLNWDPFSQEYWSNGSDKFKLRQYDGKNIRPHHSIITGMNIDAVQRISRWTKRLGIGFTLSTWWKPAHHTFTELGLADYTPLSTKCGHEPVNDTQRHWWSYSTDGHHGGFHDQLHFAETFLGHPISPSTLERLDEPCSLNT
jgi:hypothetical protein